MRAYVQQRGDLYLCPLSGVHVSAASLQRVVAPVQANTQAVTTIHRPSDDGSWQERLANSQVELARVTHNEHKRGKKVLREVAEVREVAEAIVHRSRVGGLLEVAYREPMVSEQSVRRYGPRAAGTRVEIEVRLSVQVNADAVTLAESCLGWHV